MTKASEEAYNPSLIHPAKRSAVLGGIVKSVRRYRVRLVMLGRVMGCLAERCYRVLDLMRAPLFPLYCLFLRGCVPSPPPNTPSKEGPLARF